MQIDKEQGTNDLVSFIVIAYNARNTIRSCIESILAQKVCKQVILVDNNSTDGMADEVYGLPAILLFEPERCRGTARNRGLEVAEGNLIAFVDADVELPANWTSIALGLLAEYPDVVAVGGPGFTPGNSWVAKAIDGIHYGNQLNMQQNYVASLAAMDIMYRGDAIRGKRFTKLWAAEDPEFNFQLATEGYRFLYSRDLAVTHHHVSSLRQLLSRSYRYGMWFLSPYRQHPRMITLGVVVRVMYLPVVLILGSLSFSRPIVGGLLILWLSLPILTYSLLAFRLICSASFSARMQFVLVHSLKQYAQMIGIWAGILVGTGSFAKRSKSDGSCEDRHV